MAQSAKKAAAPKRGAAAKAKAAPERLSSTAGALTLRVEPFRPAPAAVVTVAFRLRANPWVLACLEAESPPACPDYSNFDATAVAYAAFLLA